MVPEVWAAKGDTARTITGLHLQGMGVEAVGARGGAGEVGDMGSLHPAAPPRPITGELRVSTFSGGLVAPHPRPLLTGVRRRVASVTNSSNSLNAASRPIR